MATTMEPRTQRKSNVQQKPDTSRSVNIKRRHDGTTLLRITQGKVTTYTLWRTRQGYLLEYYDWDKQLVKAYHVTCDRDPLSARPDEPLFCSCPDCTYRNRACKHMLALAAVFIQAEKESTNA